MKNKSTPNGTIEKKHKLTKRGKLYLANGIAFVVFFVLSYFIATFEGGLSDMLKILLAFLLIQCVFTFLSLIVYYLSIMADALNKRYLDIEKTDKETDD